MNFLLIYPGQIIVSAIFFVIIYIYAIIVLYKSKSGIFPYLALFFIPILGALGIVIGSLILKSKKHSTE